jgi:hypothetical protein
MSKPARLFELMQVVKVPKKIHDQETATVVGVEWGPDCKTTASKCPTWAYRLKFPTGGEWWIASQEEIQEWNS